MRIFSFWFLNRFLRDFLVRVTFTLQFVRFSTSRFPNYNYWGIILLHTQIQKFSSILKWLRKNHEKSLCCSFFRDFPPKCRSTAFYAPRINRSDISTGNRAHQVLPLTIYHHLAPEKSESLLIKSRFFLWFTLYPQFEEFFYDQIR